MEHTLVSSENILIYRLLRTHCNVFINLMLLNEAYIIEEIRFQKPICMKFLYFQTGFGKLSQAESEFFAGGLYLMHFLPKPVLPEGTIVKMQIVHLRLDSIDHTCCISNASS